MSISLPILTSAIVPLFILLLFALVSAGRRADEGEEKLLELMLSPVIRDARAKATQIPSTGVSAATSRPLV